MIARPWDADGVALIEARGGDLRSALEAGLRAMLALTVAPASDAQQPDRSAPIRGEGDDAAGLFADLVDDLLAQLAHFGNGLSDVELDGLLRRDQGGYIAWGYATGTLEMGTALALPRLDGLPEVLADDSGVIVRARLHRS